jgi:hypothetical protein
MKRVNARAVLYGRSNRMRELADGQRMRATTGGEQFASTRLSSGQRDESTSEPAYATDGLQPVGG